MCSSRLPVKHNLRSLCFSLNSFKELLGDNVTTTQKYIRLQNKHVLVIQLFVSCCKLSFFTFTIDTLL